MNILIVEDQEDWQDLYSEAFNKPDTDITVVDNVSEALRIIRQGDKMFDLALVDKGGSGRWSGEPDIIGHRDGLHVLDLLKDEQPACLRVLGTAEPYVRGAFDKFNVNIFYDKRFGDLMDIATVVAGWYDEGYYQKTGPMLVDGRSSGSKENLRL